MLHTINDQGTIQWHCVNPACSYHSCADWDRERHCPHHPNRNTAPSGQLHTAHGSDPGIRYISDHIELPTCQECGDIVHLRVHRDEELLPPVVTRDELSNKIVQVAPHPSPRFHGNLWIIDADVVRHPVPHPTLAHLAPHEIEQLKATIRTQAPEAPVDWMQTETTRLDIREVYQHPAIARHQELARQLIAAGKAPPEQ